MPDYTQDEWQRLIEIYNRELMAQYAASHSTAPSPAVEESSASEANEEFAPPSSEGNEQTSPPVPMPMTPEVHAPFEPPESALTDIGRLQVRVSTENQAIPIVGAVVTVTQKRQGRTELVRTMITDENGLTPIIDLPTKDRALSLVPGNPSPFASYNVDVSAQGYVPKRFVDLPIYGGVTAIQSVSMIPLPEAGGDDMVLTYPQGGPIGL